MRHPTLIEGLAAAAATGTVALFVRWAQHAHRRPAPAPALRLLHIEHGAESEDWEPFDPPPVLRDAVAALKVGWTPGGIYPLGEHGHQYVPPGGHRPHWDPGEPMPHFTVDPEKGTMVQHVSLHTQAWAPFDQDQGPARSVFLEPGATVYDASDVRWPTQLIDARLRIAPPGSSVVIHRDGSGELVLPEDWAETDPEWAPEPGDYLDQIKESRNWRAQPPPGWLDVTTFGDPVGVWQTPDNERRAPFRWEWTEGLEWERTDGEPTPPAA